MSSELFGAIERGDAATVRDLIEANPALVSTRKKDGESAILLALYHRRREIAEIILAKGPELNIFEASAAGKLECVRALAQAEPASVNGYSYDGWTPLHLAAFFGHSEVAEFLLAHGADVIAVSRNSNGNNPPPPSRGLTWRSQECCWRRALTSMPGNPAGILRSRERL